MRGKTSFGTRAEKFFFCFSPVFKSFIFRDLLKTSKDREMQRFVWKKTKYFTV